jgi:hypothetical protein
MRFWSTNKPCQNRATPRSALRSALHKKAGKGLAVTVHEECPQDRDDEGERQAGYQHEQVKAQNVHDHRAKDRQRQWHMYWMVLHQPVEPARITGEVK